MNEAEKERNESEQDHRHIMIKFQDCEEVVHHLQRELKRAIAKSKLVKQLPLPLFFVGCFKSSHKYIFSPCIMITMGTHKFLFFVDKNLSDITVI